VLIATVRSGMEDLTTADGRMVARIRASVDAAEAERTAERVARAAEQRRQTGKLHGGPRIFGYVHPTKENGVGYCQVIDEPAAEAIRFGIGRWYGLGTRVRPWIWGGSRTQRCRVTSCLARSGVTLALRVRGVNLPQATAI